MKIKAREKELLAEFQDYDGAKHYAIGLGASKHHFYLHRSQFLLKFTSKKLWRKPLTQKK
jgi:hypothetical protein